MRIYAAQRLYSMAIHQGDNYSLGAKVAKAYLTRDAMRRFKVLQTHGTQALVASVNAAGTIYMLVSCSNEEKFKDLMWGFQHAKQDTMAEHGAKSVDAMISLHRGEVGMIWVDKNLRGRGFGKALYNVAHKYSKQGIKSSTGLGTMSLAVWLSLFKSNKKIELWVDRKPVSRKDVRVSGLHIAVPGHADLTLRDAPNFTFRWPK